MEFPVNSDQFFGVHMYEIAVRETWWNYLIRKLKMDPCNKIDFHPPCFTSVGERVGEKHH